MISNLIKNSIQYRWLVILVTGLTAIAGAFAFLKLPIDAVPDITNVQVQVNTPVQALSPEEIERAVTIPIEMVLNGIPRVSHIRSLTRFGISQVTVSFEDKTDIYLARQWVAERLQGLNRDLPEGAIPQLGPVTSGLGEVYHYVVEAKSPAIGQERLKQLEEIRALQDWYIKPRLLTVQGVAEVNTIGGHARQYMIQPDPQKMVAFGIHFSDIGNAIRLVNKNAGGGYIEQTADQYLVQGAGLFQNLEDIKNVPIKVLENLRPVTVADVATVEIGHELRLGAALHNGEEAVLGTVLMLLGENSRSVSLKIDAKIEEIKTSLPEDFIINTVYDRSELVNATLNTVKHNLLYGAALVILVLFLLVGNLRAALITAIVIPLSLLITFILMRKFNISGNLVSLGALDFGIIVDGAVIVLDNCVRHVHDKTQKLKRKLTNTELKATIHEATLEIRTSAGFGELVVIVAFLPIFAFIGIEGKMFIPMAATFIFAILGALVLSFTFVPALASLILKGNVKDQEPWIMRKLHNLYIPVLHWGLRSKRLILALGASTIIIGGVLFTRLGGEFLPQLNEGSIALQFIRPTSIGLSHSVSLEEVSQKIIMEFQEVRDVFSRIGSGEIATDPMGPNISDAFLMLKPQQEWPKIKGKSRTKEELVKALIHRLEETTPGQRILASQPIQLRFNELMEGTRADVSLKIFGENQAQINEIAEHAVSIIQNIPGAGDVEPEVKGMISVLDVQPKLGKLKQMGMSPHRVLESINYALGGQDVGVFYEGLRRFPIVIRYHSEARNNLEYIKNLPVGVKDSTTLPLKDVAHIDFTETYSSLSREQTKRRSAVLINPRGRDTESFIREAQTQIQTQLELPPGYYLEWGGNFKNLAEAKARLLLLAPLTLLLVLLMIYAAFKNLVETLLIFLCVPFALVGGALALLLAGIPFSVSAGVGFIALSGIAVLNGVVLVNYFNELRARGANGKELVLTGANLRLRPVLMTALVDIFGFLPMMLATGMGSEIQKPLATVIIGGILSSMILTLLILPTLYLALEKQILKFQQVKL